MSSNTKRPKTISRSLLALSRKLFSNESEQAEFCAAFAARRPAPDALVWLQARVDSFDPLPPRPWQPAFVECIVPGQKPGKSKLHEQGAYYCMDLSSVFAAMPILHSFGGAARPVKAVIDVCAAPGGKSIFAWKTLAPEILVCNEIVKKRRAALISNLTRCGVAGAAVVSADSKFLAEACPASADLVMVDAPCSGQSLLIKEEKSPGCFHPSVINMNSNRQKRILANSAAMVAPGGFLAYMTCTFSERENEGVIKWFLRKFLHFQVVAVPELSGFQSHLADFACYRQWPHRDPGAGGFSALLQNTKTSERAPLHLELLRPAWKSV